MIVRSKGRARRLLVGMSLASALALAPAVSFAQSTPQDRAVAQSLYDNARALMADSKFESACPKLEESQRLDPALATLFHLADCYEHIGRTASAWAAYLDVAAASKRAGRADREQVARDKAAALAPKLSKLTVNVAATSQVPGLVVKRDGAVVREGQLGTPLPVDTGKHVVEASAPGKVSWQGDINVTEEGKIVQIEIPKLVDSAVAAVASPEKAQPPAATTTMPPAESPSHSLGTQRTIALVVAGVGVVGVGIGSIVGLRALSKNSDSNASGRCVGNTCDAEGKQLRDDARSAGNLSTVAFVAGGVLMAGGAVLWFTAPSGSSLQVSPAVGSGSYGANLRAVW